MSELQNVAIKQIQEEHQKAKYDRKASVMAKPTLNALINFCKQSEDFAEAIHDSNKTFADCMEEISKDIGTSISDIEVFQKAVKFYMPSAQIDVVMTIITAKKENKTNPQKYISNRTINLNLLDLL